MEKRHPERERSGYRLSEVSKMLGVTPSTVTKWKKEKKIPIFNIDTLEFVPAQWFDEHVDFSQKKLVEKDEQVEYRKWFAKLTPEQKLKEILILMAV